MRNTNLLYCRAASSYPTALPPRELDERTRLRIQEVLCSFQPKRVRVIAVFGASENVLFAKQIRNYLERSGWNTEPVVEIAAQAVGHNGVFFRMGLHESTVLEIVVGANSAGDTL
jgi:hypothetical protein